MFHIVAHFLAADEQMILYRTLRKIQFGSNISRCFPLKTIHDIDFPTLVRKIFHPHQFLLLQVAYNGTGICSHSLLSLTTFFQVNRSFLLSIKMTEIVGYQITDNRKQKKGLP